MLIQAALLLSAACLLHATVLDPAMFLAPAPPLAPGRFDPTPGQRWTQPPPTPELADPSDPTDPDDQAAQRWRPLDAGLGVVPLAKKADIGERMESAETFWPRFSSRAYTQQPTYKVPITFAVSGTYGGYNAKPGIVGSTYMSGSLGAGATRGLAGAGYSGPGYGTRAYGKPPGAWTGWGNGRWGHYGQG